MHSVLLCKKIGRASQRAGGYVISPSYFVKLLDLMVNITLFCCAEELPARADGLVIASTSPTCFVGASRSDSKVYSAMMCTVTGPCGHSNCRSAYSPGTALRARAMIEGGPRSRTPCNWPVVLLPRCCPPRHRAHGAGGLVSRQCQVSCHSTKGYVPFTVPGTCHSPYPVRAIRRTQYVP